MAEGALAHGVPEYVATLAESIASSQRSEIKVLSTMLAERGGTPPPALDFSPHDGEEADGHHGGLEAGDVVNWAFPASAVVALAWLAVDASRRRRVAGGDGQGMLVSSLLATLVAAASGVAGVLHLALTPAHLDTGLGAGVVFLVGALAQLAVAGAVWAWPDRRTIVTAAVVSAVLTVTYVVFRFVPPPGAAAPETTDAVGLVVQGLQMIVVVAAVVAFRRRPVTPADGSERSGLVHAAEHHETRVGR